MNRLIIGAVCMLATGLAFALYSRGNLKAENARLQASIAAYKVNAARQKEIDRREREFLMREADEAKASAQRQLLIINMEGGDAPLSDYLNSVAGVLYE
jgi:multidrug efflux pump subunit AcrA (membrane-fusion protein)